MVVYWPPDGGIRKKKEEKKEEAHTQTAQAFTQTGGKYVVTKLEHKLYSFRWNLLKKKDRKKLNAVH